MYQILILFCEIVKIISASPGSCPLYVFNMRKMALATPRLYLQMTLS